MNQREMRDLDRWLTECPDDDDVIELGRCGICNLECDPDEDVCEDCADQPPVMQVGPMLNHAAIIPARYLQAAEIGHCDGCHGPCFTSHHECPLRYQPKNVV